jgi:hypothetical protein
MQRPNDAIGVPDAASVLVAVLLLMCLVGSVSGQAVASGQRVAMPGAAASTSRTPSPSPAPATGAKFLEAIGEPAQEEIQSGQIPSPSKVLEVRITFDEDLTAPLSIASATVKNGYAPKSSTDKDLYVARLLDEGGQVVSEYQFEIPNKVSAPPAPGGQEASPPIRRRRFDFAISLGWATKSKLVQVVSPGGHVVAAYSVGGVERVNNTPDFYSIHADQYQGQDHERTEEQSPVGELPRSASHVQTVDDQLDMTIIGDKYEGDFTTFHSDVDRFVSKLLTFEPYKSRASQIRINYVDNSQDLGCVYDGRLILCDHFKVVAALNTAGAIYDAFGVLVKDGTYGGGSDGFVSVAYNGPYEGEVLTHELGHAFGRLQDEYLLYGTDGPIDFHVHANCYGGRLGSSEWASLVGMNDYHEGCFFNNWLRPSESSLMLDIMTPYFNAVSQRMISARIDDYTQGRDFGDGAFSTASIVSPASNATVSSVVTVSVNAADDKGVAWVQLLIDGRLISTAYVAPYQFIWSTAQEVNAEHVLQARAYDTYGHVTNSERIRVRTSNPGRDLADVNCDGSVDINDARLVLRYVYGWMPLPAIACSGGGVRLSAADADGNGKVEKADAIAILLLVDSLSNPIVSYVKGTDAAEEDSDGDGIPDAVDGDAVVGLSGDLNCDGTVTAADALQELRFSTGLTVSTSARCPSIGSGDARLVGDINCDRTVGSSDAVLILRYVAGVPITSLSTCARHLAPLMSHQSIVIAPRDTERH